MSLSVCLLTDAPAPRVAALVEPLREVADEIVLATDAAADPERVAQYRTLASRVFRVEFVQYDRHLAWLYAQCRGDWILRLDGDEVPSTAFAEALPELTAARDVLQYWVPVAWLDPEGAAVLDETPWSAHYVNRLISNDASLHRAGLQHADRIEPRAYLEEPVYHLSLAVNDLATRRSKVVRYDILRPGMIAPGGGRLHESRYLPELRARPLARHPLPAADRERVERALRADVPVKATAGAAPYVCLAELDQHWAGRPVAQATGGASIELHERPPRMAPGENRAVFLKVRNEGCEHWPRHLDHRPLIRLGYRWTTPDGGGGVDTGLRGAFPKVVRPGETVIVPLTVVAPRELGEHVLEVDMVHELVRWFGCTLRIPVHVAHPTELPPRGPRLTETPASEMRRRWRRRRIPRRLHRIWLGGGTMSESHLRFGETFAHHHPDWEMRLWNEADLPELGISDDVAARARSASELSDLMRFAILARVGGVYVDTDVECLRPFDLLLRGVDGFVALESPGVAGTAILGAVPRHPVFVRAARDARVTVGTGVHSAESTGPGFLTRIVEQEGSITIFGAHLFYPSGWDDAGPPTAESLAGAYAMHHWDGSWRAAVDQS